MEKKIILYLCFLVFLGGILTNIFLLNLQCDPFISTTVIMGKCIEQFGNIHEATNYITQCSKFGAWQAHSKEYIIYEPLSGVLTCMISEITNIPLIKVCYFPLPYLLYFLIIYCIIIQIYSYSKRYSDYEQIKERVSIYFVLFSTIYAFIGLYCIGKFYVLEYHGIYFVYILATYYLLIKMILKNDRMFCSQAYILLLIIFLANVYTHYNFPLTIVGGIIFYLIAYGLLFYLNITQNNKINQSLVLRQSSKIERFWINITDFIQHFTANATLGRLIIVFIMIISFQQFYYVKLASSSDLLTSIHDLGVLLLYRVTKSGESGIVTGTLYPFIDYFMMFKKTWHIFFVVLSILITLITAYGIVEKKILMSPVLFIYLILIGRDITNTFSYYTQYGSFYSLELQDAWLLNALLLLPILNIKSVNNQKWKKIGNALITCLLLSSVLLVGWTTFETGTAFGYNAFPYQVKEEGETLYDYIIENTEKETIICGSMQSTTGMYEHIFYNIEKLGTVYPKLAQGYMIENETKKHKDIYEIYQSLKKEKVSKFILTDYETKRGFYGGLVGSPLTREETSLFENILENNENLIYNSKRARLYDLT